MDKSILRRIEALETRKPKDIIVYAVTIDGDVTEVRVKDIITDDGELKKGFSGIGNPDGKLISLGNSLKDLDRILRYLRDEAEKDECVHSK